ncbi:hypothetical protein THOM_1931 [Trachipleistophora hominis]|uniref:Uncharacterized protein n=1 Tax=Trachipleistophora hominis TaxID=72359 RepID=L7JUZ5_TRAHO|nr:hypothetical protein THOM_1931 [Trachipleistophora hominis]
MVEKHSCTDKKAVNNFRCINLVGFPYHLGKPSS